jgi:hypothetical protein
MAFTDYVKHAEIVKGTAKNAVISWTSETHFITNSNAFTQPADINFLMSGTCGGISSADWGFTASFDSLNNNIDCPWILDGLINLTIPGDGYTTGTVDFITNDGCSNKMKYNFQGSIIYLWKDDKYLRN